MQTSTKILLASAAVVTVGIAATWSMSDSTTSNCIPSPECANWTTMLENIDSMRLALLDQYQETCSPLFMSIQDKISQGMKAFDPAGELEMKCNKLLLSSLENFANFYNASQSSSKYCCT